MKVCFYDALKTTDRLHEQPIGDRKHDVPEFRSTCVNHSLSIRGLVEGTGQVWILLPLSLSNPYPLPHDERRRASTMCSPSSTRGRKPLRIGYKWKAAPSSTWTSPGTQFAWTPPSTWATPSRVRASTPESEGLETNRVPQPYLFACQKHDPSDSLQATPYLVIHR